ncbi:MAG: septum formation inhibitor Maf [Saprospiraceae bacterium]|nr:septum formation inhibitor Maf [Saprospiraceae bacterium]
MNNRLRSIALFTLVITCISCGPQSEKQTVQATPAAQVSKLYKAMPASPEFNAYWYQGKAELCTYDVTQDRYGEIREAEQVNVFVTEDFSKQKHVKLDDPANAGTDRLPVLKLNSIRRFQTGIYDYSIMQSVFTPVDGTPTIKTTCTVQDWCGQVFAQSNLEAGGYQLRSFSYFESEGDEDKRMALSMQEDDLAVRIRINPEGIPTGAVNIMPSILYSRIRHKPYQVQSADIQLEKGEKESVLHLKYTGIPRTLDIRFETAAPHRILGWEETDGGKLTSKGRLKTTRMEAYWTQNSNKFSPMRDSLQLHF